MNREHFYNLRRAFRVLNNRDDERTVPRHLVWYFEFEPNRMRTLKTSLATTIKNSKYLQELYGEDYSSRLKIYVKYHIGRNLIEIR